MIKKAELLKKIYRYINFLFSVTENSQYAEARKTPTKSSNGLNGRPRRRI